MKDYTENLERATVALLADEIVVEVIVPGLTDEKFKELLNWTPMSVAA